MGSEPSKQNTESFVGPEVFHAHRGYVPQSTYNARRDPVLPSHSGRNPTTNAVPATSTVPKPAIPAAPEINRAMQPTVTTVPANGRFLQPTTIAALATSRVIQPAITTTVPANGRVLQLPTIAAPASGRVVQPTTITVPANRRVLQPTTIAAPATSKVGQPSTITVPATSRVMQPTTTTVPATSRVLQPTSSDVPVLSNSRGLPTTTAVIAHNESVNKSSTERYPDLPNFIGVEYELLSRKSEKPTNAASSGVPPVHKKYSEMKFLGSLRRTSKSTEIDEQALDDLNGSVIESRIYTPSCPDFSLLDPLEGLSAEVENIRALDRKCCLACTGDLKSRESAISGGLVTPVGLIGSRERKIEPSPGGNEFSHKSSANGDRNLNRRRKQKNTSRDIDDEPPKYEDVFGQPKVENKKFTPKEMASQRQFKGPFADRKPKDVNALNDLIKKEFGSLGEPTHNLPAIDVGGKLFSGRNCLYIGNLPFGVTREDFNELMAPYGDIVVDHYNAEKKFGFVRLKNREEAENAERNLDGYVFKGRTLRVRFSNKNICFKVLNLDKWVTNELLRKAFSAFGEVERAEIIVEGGKPTGEGFLEFSDKKAGQMAFEACLENCFLLTSSLRPVILEEVKPNHYSRSYSERQINKNNTEYKKSREVGPRFMVKGSAENMLRIMWKSFYDRRKREEEDLAKEFKEQEQLLEEQIRSILN